MSTVFVLLFMLFVGLLVWGLVSPKSLGKFSKKPLTRKEAGIGFGALALLFMVLSGITTPSASIKTQTPNDPVTQQESSSVSEAESVETEPITKSITETEVIPFESKTVQDSSMAKGTTKVTTAGVNGLRTLTFEVSTLDGVETSRKLTEERVTTAPVAQVTKVGTKTSPQAQAPVRPSGNCDPNYSGACVPIDSDVDCSSGSGNGPSYVRGPVTVIGRDIYDLDRDGNGTGCENG
jgi:hypothetical protein